MEASLESESSRQKRQQEYGYDPRAGIRAVSSNLDVCQSDAKGQSRVKCRGESDEAGQEEAAEQDQVALRRRNIGKVECKATYKRSRIRRSASRCVPSSDEESQDYIPKKQQGKADSPPGHLRCHSNTAISSRLRDRKNLKKPVNKFSEMILYPEAQNAPRKKSRKVCKKVKEGSLLVGDGKRGRHHLGLSLFLFTPAGDYTSQCHAAVLSDCDQCRVARYLLSTDQSLGQRKSRAM